MEGKRMTPADRRALYLVIAAVVVSGLIVLLVAGCGGKKAGADSRASALATSTVAQQARTDAQRVLAGCFPVSGGKVQVPASRADLTRDVACEEIPSGSRFRAVACIVSAVANGGKAADKASEEDAILNATAACIQKYRAGGTPSASASAS